MTQSDTDKLEPRALLKMWRDLVQEGGVPRYTVLPGAALNTLVGWTDRELARTPSRDAKAIADEINASFQRSWQSTRTPDTKAASLVTDEVERVVAEIRSRMAAANIEGRAVLHVFDDCAAAALAALKEQGQ
jgi:hypothetical protein